MLSIESSIKTAPRSPRCVNRGKGADYAINAWCHQYGKAMQCLVVQWWRAGDATAARMEVL